MSYLYSWVWIYPDNHYIPDGAFHAGSEGPGCVVYVARAKHEGSVTPGKLLPTHGCYIGWGGREHFKNEYEVLVGSAKWTKWRGALPDNAIVGGKSEGGEYLYIGRVKHEGRDLIGKIQPSHGCCYVPLNGQEHRFEDYEVLLW